MIKLIIINKLQTKFVVILKIKIKCTTRFQQNNRLDIRQIGKYVLLLNIDLNVAQNEDKIQSSIDFKSVWK